LVAAEEVKVSDRSETVFNLDEAYREIEPWWMRMLIRQIFKTIAEDIPEDINATLFEFAYIEEVCTIYKRI
jgi:hypothetical protein